MDKLFLPCKLALIAKKFGFDEPCMAKYMLMVKGDTVPVFLYNNEAEGVWFKHNSKDVSNLNGNGGSDFLWSAPMYQQIIDWFREKYDLNISIIGSHKEGTTIREYFPTFDRIEALTINKEYLDYYKALNKTIEESFKYIEKL